MNAIDYLKNEHDKHEEMWKRIETALENENHEKAAELYENFRKEIEAHMTIEEEIFYPEYKDKEKTHEISMEGIEEHHAARLIIRELNENNKDTDKWKAKFTVLKENVEHHEDEEEDEFFKKVKEISDDEKLEELGRKLEARKKELM